jgi:hypothetical protein
MRRVGSVVAALFVAFVVVVLIEGVASVIWPPPAGLDLSEQANVEAWFAATPVKAQLMVVLAYLCASGAGAFTAARVARDGELASPLSFSGVFGLVTIINLVSLPHATWMVVASMIALGVGCGLGTMFGIQTPERGTRVG